MGKPFYLGERRGMKFFDDCKSKKHAQERYGQLKIIFKSSPDFLNVLNREYNDFRCNPNEHLSMPVEKQDNMTLWKRLRRFLLNEK